MNNYIIEFETWDSFEANSKEEAVKKFEKAYPNATFLRVVE